MVEGRRYPRVAPEIGGCAHFLYLVTLHLVFGEALLHAPANKCLAVLGESVENLDQGQGLLVWLVGASCEILHSVDEAARSLHVRYLLEILFIDHLEVAGRGQDQQYAEVEQVLLLELLHARLC